MLHFVTSYMKQNKSRKQTLESAQYGLEISFNTYASGIVFVYIKLIYACFSRLLSSNKFSNTSVTDQDVSRIEKCFPN